MAIIDWPLGDDWRAARWQPDLHVPEAAHRGFYSGLTTRRSNLADRMRGTLVLPPTSSAAVAAQREGMVTHLRSTGDWVRFSLPQRQVPIGTARGTMTVLGAVAAGLRSIVIAGTGAGATLLSGDFLGVGGNLIIVGPAGATANGSGQITVPLGLPLPKAVGSGAAVTWNAPLGVWQLDTDSLPLDYGAPLSQDGFALPFLQVPQ